MPGTIEDETFQIATIDVGPYLADPGSPPGLEVVRQVRRACLSSGFFQITGHGISKALQRRILSATTDFFTLPLPQKQELDCKKTVGYRGYETLATQSYHEGVKPDLKESFYVGEHIPPSHPLHGRFFSGPNVWPPSEVLSFEAFQAPCEEYFAAAQALTVKILHLVGASLLDESEQQDANVELSKVNGTLRVPSVINDLTSLDSSPACPFRLLHYPSVSPADAAAIAASEQPQYAASAHTDFSAITLLLQDENPGLEVLNTSAQALATGKDIWHPVQPNPDAYVVNVGDIVHKITRGAYKSSMHRVVCKRPEKDRYSIVFFIDGCLEAKLTPVDCAVVNTSPALQTNPSYAHQSVEQHMIERLTMSITQGAKKDAVRDKGETVDISATA